MIRISILLLALLLAAAPGHGQAAAAVTPLPASLQPDARTWGAAGPAALKTSPMEGAAIGMGVGCVVIGVLAASMDAETSEIRTSNALLGCGFGAFAGGVMGFTFFALKELFPAPAPR